MNMTTNMTTSQTLRRTKALIEDPAHWTHGWGDDEITPWPGRMCVMHALARVAGAPPLLKALPVMKTRAVTILIQACVAYDGRRDPRCEARTSFAVGTWNDLHCHSDVMGMLDIAIALAEEQEYGSMPAPEAARSAPTAAAGPALAAGP